MSKKNENDVIEDILDIARVISVGLGVDILLEKLKTESSMMDENKVIDDEKVEKTSWKELIFKEPHEPKHMTVEEAFAEGISAGMGEVVGETNYDIAARKCARLIYQAAQENCMVGLVIGKMHKICDNVGKYLPEDSIAYRSLCQDWFSDMDNFFTYVLVKEVPKIASEVDHLGPTGFMWDWATVAATMALIEDGYFDKFMWPKNGTRSVDGHIQDVVCQ